MKQNLHIKKVKWIVKLDLCLILPAAFEYVTFY